MRLMLPGKNGQQVSDVPPVESAHGAFPSRADPSASRLRRLASFRLPKEPGRWSKALSDPPNPYLSSKRVDGENTSAAFRRSRNGLAAFVHSRTLISGLMVRAAVLARITSEKSCTTRRKDLIRPLPAWSCRSGVLVKRHLPTLETDCLIPQRGIPCPPVRHHRTTARGRIRLLNLWLVQR